MYSLETFCNIKLLVFYEIIAILLVFAILYWNYIFVNKASRQVFVASAVVFPMIWEFVILIFDDWLYRYVFLLQPLKKRNENDACCLTA